MAVFEILKTHIKNRPLAFCFLMVLFMACNNKADDQKLQKTVQIDTSLIWVDFILGGPAPIWGRYDGIDSLVKKYKLRYQRIEVGCEFGEEEERLKAKYDQQNQRYFKAMEKVHGKDWKQRFDAELHTLDSINWVQAEY